jgi:hypothetical protein
MCGEWVYCYIAMITDQPDFPYAQKQKKHKNTTTQHNFEGKNNPCFENNNT